MDTMSILKLTALDMLKSAAEEHKRLMDEDIVAFQVPWAMFHTLQKEPQWQQSGFEWMGYIGNFTFMARPGNKISMFEKGSTFPFSVMEDEE